MNWEQFGSFDVYVDDFGRICARVFKHERGFGAMLTPVNPPKDYDGFIGYFMTPGQAKVAIEGRLGP